MVDGFGVGVGVVVFLFFWFGRENLVVVFVFEL